MTAARTSSSATPARRWSSSAAIFAAPSAPRARRPRRPRAADSSCSQRLDPGGRAARRASGSALRAQRDDHRLAEVEVGDAARAATSASAAPASSSRTSVSAGDFELAEQRGHLLLHLGRAADVGERPAAQPGRLAHEVAVGRRADADREQAAVAEPLADRLRTAAPRCRRRRRSGRSPVAAGPACSPPSSARTSAGSISVPPSARRSLDVPLGPAARSAGLAGWARRTGCRSVVEPDDVEGVGRREAAAAPASAPPWPARSTRRPSSPSGRARRSPRAAAAPLDAAGRRRHHHQQRVRPRPSARSAAPPPAPRPRRLPHQLEVAIGRHARARPA